MVEGVMRYSSSQNINAKLEIQFQACHTSYTVCRETGSCNSEFPPWQNTVVTNQIHSLHGNLVTPSSS